MATRADDLRDEVDILEYRSGDVSALERLISRWQPRVYSYIFTMLGERDAAWDVSQEFWIAVLAALAKDSRIDHFASWLFGVAHNKCVSHLRTKRRLAEINDAVLDQVDSRAETSASIVLRAEDAQIVREALMDLSLPLREAMLLFHIDGLALDQIAAILGVPRGTVQSRLHAGRQTLKRLLARKGYRNDGR